MPRIYLQVTDNVPEIGHSWEHLRQLVQVMCEHESIDPKSVKAFIHEHHSWAMGQGAPAGFVNLKIAMLPRADGVKEEIADMMHAKLCELYRESLDAGRAAVSVDIRTMDAVAYRLSQ